MRISLQAGYVLHTRPWRDTSLLVLHMEKPEPKKKDKKKGGQKKGGPKKAAGYGQ